MAAKNETPSPCPKCDSVRVWGDGEIALVRSKGNVWLKPTSSLWPIVCTECGYTELYVKTPDLFKPK